MFDILEVAPLTRALALGSVVLSVLSAAKVTSALDYFYSPRMIIEFNQYWRIITSLFFFGDFSFQTLFRLFSFVQYSATLESKVFMGKPGDYVIFLVFGWTLFLAFGRLICVPFLSPCLVAYALYYWAKHFGDEKIRIMTLPFDISVQYMPYVSLVFDYMQGGVMSCVSTLLAFVVAHLFFFIRDVVAIEYNKAFLRAPSWLQGLALPLKSGQ
jgi:Derlin-2/3